MAYQLEPIPAFNDNYIWCLSNDRREALVVDPGDARPVLDFLSQQNLTPTAILLTHHHFDHSGGIAGLREQFPVPVYGPANSPCDQVTVALEDDDRVHWDDLEFRILTVPGHTLDHIAFFCTDERLSEPLLFCGDTLFVGGCGRVFEGTPEQMQGSLSRLRELPDEARVCCAHEYTMANLAFAAAVEPDNSHIADFVAHCTRLRKDGQPTVPGRLELEKRINPFLRWDQEPVTKAAQEFDRQQGQTSDPGDPVAVFASIRRWKDQFKG